MTDTPAQPGDEISYQAFGENFIRYLVTVPRLKGEVEDTLRKTVEGSRSALPNDLLVANYQFKPHDLQIHRRDAGATVFDGKVLVTGHERTILRE